MNGAFAQFEKICRTREYYDIPYYGLYVDKAVNVMATNFNVTPRSSNTRAVANIPVQG